MTRSSESKQLSAETRSLVMKFEKLSAKLFKNLRLAAKSSNRFLIRERFLHFSMFSNPWLIDKAFLSLFFFELRENLRVSLRVVASECISFVIILR